MDERGYIYVLANSSMPDLVKVGKTTRSPNSRAQELSGVSGVPTPFIVVYDQLFEDCSAAEEFLHTLLKQKGYRESDNREFFRAPVSEIIHIITQMPGQVKDSNLALSEEPNDPPISSSYQRGELDNLTIDEGPESYPWSGIWEEAENYYYGRGDCIQHFGEALRLYREAAKLGCLMAYLRIGSMYEDAKGVTQSNQKALDYFKEGARKGNYYCYLAMAELFIEAGHEDNHAKCMRLFFNDRKEHPNQQIEEELPFRQACSGYIIHCVIRRIFPQADTIKEMSSCKSEILDFMDRQLRYDQQHDQNSPLIPIWGKAISWASQNL